MNAVRILHRRSFHAASLTTFALAALLISVNRPSLALPPVPPPMASPPVAQDDFSGTDSHTSVSVDVLLNDTPGSAPIDPESVRILTQPETGTASVHPDTGNIEFTPEIGIEAVALVEYDVADVDGRVSNPAWVLIQVVHLPPSTIDDILMMTYNDSADIDLLDNDSAGTSPIDAGSIAIITPPLHGSCSVDVETGIVTYTPDDDFSGTDDFEYTVLDTDGVESDPAWVTVFVTNIPPQISNLDAIPGSLGMWHIEGYVLDEYPDQCTVEFGGIIAGEPSATPDETGFFRITVDLGTEVFGVATAKAIDELGEESPVSETLVYGY